MTIIKDKPAELKPRNDLDNIPEDLLGPIPAELRLGANVLMMMDPPPEVGDTVTVVARLKIKREGKELAGDEGSEMVHFRGAKIQTAWLAGQPEPPNPDADQPGLFDNDDEDSDGEPQTVGDIINGVERPHFSNETGSYE